MKEREEGKGGKETRGRKGREEGEGRKERRGRNKE